ncbi:MAG: hypothetical protein IPH18_10470 [Chitinophagaceae bacterium]|nr:hypothetical protein [Chitinophagaceae bacterium]MBK8952030.1 hypothetical protein [Chitinophagaceae bacterium]
MIAMKFFAPVIIIILSFSLTKVFSQNCKVLKAEINGTYTGECKKGKANGNGKATGTDSYNGNFVTGLPHGKGTYTWANGNVYNGEFLNGKKEGKGILVIKRENLKDSTVEGFWENDKYVGKTGGPWRLIYKSKLINEVEVEKKNDKFHRITFVITNTSGGAKDIEGGEMERLKVDEVQAITGQFGRLSHNDIHAKKTESYIDDINFPIRMKVIIGSEEIEFEFKEEASYIISLRINI